MKYIVTAMLKEKINNKTVRTSMTNVKRRKVERART
jgi:hypothetical protein